MALTYGSLFSGIGGFDLGFDRAGMQCTWQVEIDDFCRQVLTKHWPEIPKYENIRDVGKHNLSAVDVICGGFPCQPHSIAGKRKASKDARDLWPEFLRIICEIKPKWVVAENVTGLLSSENGQYFGRILRDLAEGGYNAEWRTIPAAAFGLPHLRERVFLVANNRGQRIQGRWTESFQRFQAFSWGKDGRGITKEQIRPDLYTPKLCRNFDGISRGMDRLRALGNAVVPQAAELIGSLIVEAESGRTRQTT